MLNTAQAFRKQANGSSHLQGVGMQRISGNPKFESKKPPFEPLSQLTSSLQIDSTDYSLSQPPTTMQKNFSHKDDRSFQPSLQGFGLQLQIQQSAAKEASF